MRIVKYKLSLNGKVDEKMWNNGWRVSVAFKIFNVKILKYTYGY